MKNQFITPVKFNPVKLLRAYQDLERDVPKTLYNNIKDGKRYGWALTSRTGKCSDIHGRRYRDYENEKQFTIPTRGYSGYFMQILDEMEAVIGPIYRARIITLVGEREIAPHHDGHDGTNFLRYHIPIIPNEECEFMSMHKKFVMHEAGRLYRFPGWEIHGVVNRSGLRSHLMFSAYKDIIPKTPFEVSAETVRLNEIALKKQRKARRKRKKAEAKKAMA